MNVDKAVRDLRHEATVSLEEGVRRTVEWMRQVYKIEAPAVVAAD